MRILHVVPTYLPAKRYGGPIQSVHGLARAQHRLGSDVHVFTTNVDGDGTSSVPLEEPVPLEGVQVSYFPVPTARRLYWSPRMTRALGREVPTFDIVHLHSVFLLPTSTASRIARRRGVPYVLSPRGMLVPDLIRGRSFVVKKSWINLFEKSNIRHAAAVHFTSDVELDDFNKLGLQCTRTAVIPNGVELPPAKASSSNVAANVTRLPYVLFLGRLTWKKRVDALIKAMSQVPDTALVIAGNDDESLQPQLARLAEECGVGGRVHFIGFVDGEAKWALLRGASVFALPSRSENFGIAVLEAMGAGCPVIVTPEVGLSPVVQEVEAGIVVGGEPHQLGQAIKGLMDAPERRVKMGNAGKAAALKSFSWDAIAVQMEKLYLDCVRGE